MNSNVAKLRPRGSQRNLTPHIPPIARDPIDDACEVLAAFRAKQGGELDVPYADLAEDLAAALVALVAIVARPQRRSLVPWKRLPVEQARMFIDQLAALPHTTDGDCGRLLGRPKFTQPGCLT
jgi:hypothetical protein